MFIIQDDKSVPNVVFFSRCYIIPVGRTCLRFH